MNLIKNKLSNKMQTETTNALIHVRALWDKADVRACVTYNLPNDALDLVVSSQKYLHSRITADKPSTSPAEEKNDEVLNVIFQNMHLKFKKRINRINYAD